MHNFGCLPLSSIKPVVSFGYDKPRNLGLRMGMSIDEGKDN